ncbi:hypothetical protein LUZ62_045662 [Rhynchospora pubera]|uniref:Uncharacterized protein n=1 Tax=Rhynchospora pubera TaxID=906938 RepID=A0AAV8FTK5_9POAL|nr:hypothetical protein LUZ62_045662 [Rhynchospora pubera]
MLLIDFQIKFCMNKNMETSSNLVLAKENDSKINFTTKTQGTNEIPLDPTLDYIRRYLLEENVDEEIIGSQETALRGIEKPFYDILGEKYPPLQDNQLMSNQQKENHNFTICISKNQVGPSQNESLQQHTSIVNSLATEFLKGAKEGMKFLPNLKKLSINRQENKLSSDPMNKCDGKLSLGKEKESVIVDKNKSKKSSNDADLDLLEGRNHKLPMVFFEEKIRDEIFDKVLLNHGENYTREETSSIKERTTLKANYCQKNQYQYELINLKALLIVCAEAIFINDIKKAVELIQNIRKHASPIGNGTQRLACILADGLEARLAGTGNTIYRQLITRRVAAIDFLKIYEMFMSGPYPIFRVSYHCANKSILSAASNALKIHIVDFGIAFGFQWPSIIQALAEMKDRPPTLRITGVDLPRPGFHPAERVKTTGKRLEDYARDFGVPFEYHGIASQWESICVEDLCINDDEVLIVNTMFNLSQRSYEPFFGTNKSPNQFLDLIRTIKPKLFIQGIVNVSFSPYFIPRFKMVLLQYSRFFDMLDTLFPQNSKPRQQLERDILGPSIINQIACEGPDLVARRENYKQYHTRNLEAGFEQLPVDPSVVNECTEIVRSGYDERFFIEEDCNWFLQGWKGNIFYAISLWKP